MLARLLIRNYALIDELEMAPSGGLNIVTGETGAGKSIMLGALSLLMGQRADSKALSDPTRKCIVEGTFDLSTLEGIEETFEALELDYAPETIIRREISREGRSRAFVNDTPASLEALKALSRQLMDIHSQHDTLELAGQAYQLSLVDAYAGTTREAVAVADAYRQWKRQRQELDELVERARAATREQDYTQFRLTELTAARLEDPDELEILEAELDLLTNAEDIKLRLGQMADALSEGEVALVPQLKTLAGQMDRLSGYGATMASLAERLRSAYHELADVASEVWAQAEALELDPERLALVTERVNSLNTLLRKHEARTLADLIALRDSLATDLAQVEGLEEQITLAREALERLEAQTLEQAQRLSERRQQALPPLKGALSGLLDKVGMPNARIELTHAAAPLSASGVDQVQLLFSANKGVPVRELRQVASGGEFSRLMLCVKAVMAGRTQLPTLILDEIDTGISGEIARRVGKLMAHMAQNHQLIVITHMPQIAARGQEHFYVYKREADDRTHTHIRPLTDPERLQEIAQMIGGANPSVKALESARELMLS